MMPKYMTDGLTQSPLDLVASFNGSLTELIYQLTCPPSTQIVESALLLQRKKIELQDGFGPSCS